MRTGPLAFPVTPKTTELHSDWHGLTRREYFAVVILAGMGNGFADSIAALKAVERADALIKELDK